MKWMELPLSQLLSDDRNGTWGSPPKSDGNDFPVLRSTNINESSMVLNDVAFRSVSEKSVERYQLLDGDILVTTSSGSKHLIGKNALFKQPEDGQRYLFSNFTLRIRPKKDVIIPKYLHFYINSSRAKAELLRIQSTTSGLRNLNVPLYLSQAVPLPPLAEQKRIVEILNQAERLRKLRTDADSKAQRILPALFIKMFGDPASNPMGWDTVPLDKVVDIGTQLVDPNQPDFLDLPHIGGEQIEKDTGRILSPILVRNSNLRSNKFYFSSDHLLYSKIRPYLNKAAYPRFSGVCSADIYPLRPKNKSVTHLYLLSLLRTQAFLDYAKMHSDRLRIPKLNKTQLGAFEFPLPDPDLLIDFDEMAEKIESIRNGRFARQEKIEALYQIILYRSFSGDLTASWREAHLQELLQEMELQAKALGILGDKK
jgi:type I restriction enzyme, S subunit